MLMKCPTRSRGKTKCMYLENRPFPVRSTMSVSEILFFFFEVWKLIEFNCFPLLPSANKYECGVGGWGVAPSGSNRKPAGDTGHAVTGRYGWFTVTWLDGSPACRSRDQRYKQCVSKDATFRTDCLEKGCPESQSEKHGFWQWTILL